MRTILLIGLLMVSGCGEPLYGCADPTNEGLECLRAETDRGVCLAGSCEPVPCKFASDCNDGTGNDACRSLNCKKEGGAKGGLCIVAAASDGFGCSMPDSFATGICENTFCVIN